MTVVARPSTPEGEAAGRGARHRSTVQQILLGAGAPVIAVEPRRS